LLNGENQNIQDLKKACIEAWKKLALFVQDEKMRSEQANYDQNNQMAEQ